MKRILVTGASGYLGLRIVEALVAAEHEVTAAVRTPSARSAPTR